MGRRDSAGLSLRKREGRAKSGGRYADDRVPVVPYPWRTNHGNAVPSPPYPLRPQDYRYVPVISL